MNLHPLALAPISEEVAAVFLLGVGLFAIVVALCLCCYLFECLTRWFSFTCDWLGHRLAKRKVHLRSPAYPRRNQEVASRISPTRSRPALAPHPSPTAINAAIAKRTTRLARVPAPVDARDLLQPLRTAEKPFSGKVAEERSVIWVKPILRCEVNSLNVQHENSLRIFFLFPPNAELNISTEASSQDDRGVGQMFHDVGPFPGAW